MICQEILTVLCEDSNNVDLDRILVELCELVIKGQQEDQNHSGMVGACVVGPKGRAYSTSHNDNGKWSHAEREAIEYYESAYGPVDDTCTVVTTLSPCTNKMSDRAGSSCADFLASKGISKVYCGYKDPTQGGEYKVTDNSKIRHICKELADTFLKEATKITPVAPVSMDPVRTSYGQTPRQNDPVPNPAAVIKLSPQAQELQNQINKLDQVIHAMAIAKDPNQRDLYFMLKNKMRDAKKKLSKLSENFHDGKVKGKSRPGRVKRAGASCAGSVSSLRAKARKYGGEKGKMYHWCANMKSGKKK